MKKEIVIKFDAETGEITSKIEVVEDKIQKVKKEAKVVAADTAKEFNSASDKIGAALDQFTGGLFGQMKALKEGVQAAIPALNGLKGALIATGIGAVIVGVGLLVTYWEDISKWANSASDETAKQLADAQGMVAAKQAELDAVSAQENILKAQGKTEKEILQMKMAATDEIIAANELQLIALQKQKEEQIAAAQRNKDILKGIIGFITAPLTLLLTTIDQVGAALGQEFGLVEGFLDFSAGLIFDPEEVAQEADASIAETQKALTSLKNARAGYQLSIQAIDKGANDKRKADQEKANAEAAKAEADRLKKAEEDAAAELKKKEELAKAIQDIDKAIFEAKATQEEKEVQAVKDKYAQLTELAIANGLETASLEEAKQLELKAIQDRYREIKDKEDQALIDKQLADEQRVKDAKIGFAFATSAALKDLAEVLAGDNEKRAKKAFALTKALNLAEAIANTYTSITAVLADKTTPPLAKPFLIATSVATGLAAVAKIAATKFESNTPPSSVSGGGGGGGANIPTAQTTLTPNFGFLQQGANQNSIQAYVLETNVTNSQQANQKIKDQSVL
jgi:hypothetical protein